MPCRADVYGSQISPLKSPQRAFSDFIPASFTTSGIDLLWYSPRRWKMYRNGTGQSPRLSGQSACRV